jgi:hypothetical protein
MALEMVKADRLIRLGYYEKIGPRLREGDRYTVN